MNSIYRVYVKILGWLAYLSMPSAVTVFIHKLRGVKIGKGVRIHRYVYMDDYCPNYIELGNDVGLGVGTKIIAHERDLTNFESNNSITVYPLVNKKVIIEDGVYVGISSIIMPGVRIGKGSIIGPGSVISKDIPPNSTVIGYSTKIIDRFNNTGKTDERKIGINDKYDENIDERLNGIFEQTFPNADKFSIKSSPENTNGWDSLGNLNFIVAIEEEFDVDIPSELGNGRHNIGDILEFLENEKNIHNDS